MGINRSRVIFKIKIELRRAAKVASNTLAAA
jgi:hypothetical protein